MTALHALAHTLVMNSRSVEGEAVYQQYQGKWNDPNLFVNHVAWHEAVFLLDLEEYDRALEIYDTYLVKDGGKTGPATPLGR